MSLVKSTATIGGYTLISRILGFARDVTIASGLGAGFLSDAFFVSFRLPNYLRRLFAEGAFNSAFVPMYTNMLTGEGEDRTQAQRFAGEAMSFLVLVLLIVTGLFIAFMPWIMVVLAPGFADDPAKFALTVTLTRITMPYILFISLVSLLGGVLNSVHKFAAAAAAPIIMNLCLIILPTFIDPFVPNGAYGLSIAVLISGVAQWLWLAYACSHEGMLPKLSRPKLTANVKRLLTIIAPVALGAGVAQINLFIDTIIATQFDSGVSYLYYADRINELPLAVIGIAVGTALLPTLSRHVREGRQEEANRSQSHAIALSLFLSLPAAVALMVIAEPVITVMFQRGHFGPVETAATYKALIAFAFGLPAFILVKILSPAFYAHHDTKTPFKIAMVCVFVNLFFNLALMIPLRHVGMALATSIAGWVNVLLLSGALARRGWLSTERSLMRETSRIALSSMAMAAVLIFANGYAGSFLSAGEITRFLMLGVLVLLGLTAYLSIAWLTNAMGARLAVLAFIKRKR